MTWQLRVGAVQMCSTDDLQANLATCRRLIEQAAADGAQLVALPECFSFLGRKEGDKLPVAETIELTGAPHARATGNMGTTADVRGGGDDDAPAGGTSPGPVLGMLRELAAKHGIHILGGGTPEIVVGDAKRTYNTAVLLDPRGDIIARYRKIHLFDVDIPGGAVLRESDATAPGDECVVVDIGGAACGLTICYDVRFPELYRMLVKDRGADVLFVPAAFTAHTGAAHWHLLLRARAIEDQAWVVAPAQWGKHNDKRESYGHTLVVDPWGTIVAERDSGDGVVMATLDGAAVAKRRTQMPVLQHAVLWK